MYSRRRRRRESLHRRRLLFEPLEVRLPLATTSTTYSITIVEDLTGDGVTADDPLADGWSLFGGAITTTIRYTNCSAAESTTTGTPKFLGNGTSGTYSTTTFTCTGTDSEGKPFTVENLISGYVDFPMVEQPPIGEYWVYSGSDCGTTCILDHPVKRAYFHVPSAAGIVFHDHNGNGIQDSNDEPLTDVSVCVGPGIFNGEPCLGDSFFGFQFRSSGSEIAQFQIAPNEVGADGQGNYLLPAIPRRALTPLTDGTQFSLTVLPPAGTDPIDFATTGNTKFEPDTPSSTELFRDLGGFFRAEVSGRVYLDRNGNGQKDPDEQPFTARPLTILPDNNRDHRWTNELDCSFDQPCLFMQTASVGPTGTYSVLGPGNFGPNVDDRYTITEGGQGHLAWSGEENLAANFGIFENVRYVFGNVFDDKNGNGLQDAHGNPESSLSGVTIQLDLNDDGSVDRSTTTNAEGIYQFDNIGPGTHRIVQLLQDGRRQTSPENESGHLFSLTSGQPPPAFAFGSQLPPFTLSVDEPFPTEGVEFSGPIAMIRTNQPLAASAYQATIDWGDETTSSGSVVSGGQEGGTTLLEVRASHRYEKYGKYPIKVTVSDPSGFSTTSTRTAEVLDAPLSAAGFELSAIEGTSITTVVASFDDQNPFGEPSEFTASINWGDGHVTAGVVNAVVGVSKFEITGTNTFELFGSKTVTVEIRSKGGSTVQATSVVVVANAPLNFIEVRPDAVITEGRFDGGEEPSILAAFFHDENPFSEAEDFAATIDWGDGRISENAFVSRVEAGRFFIRGEHTYAAIGTYPVRIRVKDEGDASAETSASLVVTGAPLTGVDAEINAIRGVPYTGLVASFYDANSFSDAKQFTAMVNWGDGFRSSADVFFVEKSEVDGGLANYFHVRSQHTYYEAADYPITVTISDAGGGTSVESTAFVLFLDMEVFGEGTVQAIEGAPFHGVVATITDPGGRNRPSDYRATIDWGDEETSRAEIRFRESFVDNQGVPVSVFDVIGSHVYEVPGEADIQVEVTDSLGRTAAGLVPVAVQNAALNAQGTAVVARSNVPFEGVVARFTDGDLTGIAADYFATIDWADGTVSEGIIRGSADRGYEVIGSHMYEDVEGTSDILVEVEEPDGAFATASSSVVILPSDDPGENFVHDLTVSSIEVVQTVQRADNSIPLIAGKNAVARVYVYTGDFALGPVPNVNAILRGFRNGQELPGSPLSPTNGPFTAPYDVLPTETDSSLNFQIPVTWTAAGDLELKAEVNQAVTESQRNNNALNVTISFIERNQLDIAYIAICYQPDPEQEKHCPSDAIASHDALLRKIFPVSADGVEYRSFVIPEIIWSEPLVSTEDVLKIVADLRSLYDLADSLEGDVPDQLAAWLPLLPGSEIPLGFADPKWMGSSGRITIQQDTSMAPLNDPLDAQFTLAHEIAHNLGRFHVHTEDGCGADDPFTDWPYESGMIGELGFDFSTSQVIPPNKFDVMSYCSPPSDNIWISPFTFEKLFAGNLEPLDDLSLESSNGSRNFRTPHEPADYLVLQGFASRDGTNAQIESMYRITSTIANPISDPFGNYCIHVRDSLGFLAKQCFNLDFTDERSGKDLDEESFSVIVPVPSDVQRISLRKGTTELDTVGASLHAPSVQITNPKPGETGLGLQTITWSAFDDDGDSLKFSVLHSPDGISGWTPLAIDLIGSSFSFETGQIPAGAETSFRVLASDGWHTSIDTVGPITLPGDRPWRNPVKPFDTNRNSTIEPFDVLVIINELNEGKVREAQTGRLQGRPAGNAFYYDPTGDGFCTPLDALQIINFLNNRSAEAESSGDSATESPKDLLPIRLLVVANVDGSVIHESETRSKSQQVTHRQELVSLSAGSQICTSSLTVDQHDLESIDQWPEELCDWLESEIFSLTTRLDVDSLLP